MENKLKEMKKYLQDREGWDLGGHSWDWCF